MENASIKKGSYTTVCCGIDRLGRGSAFVLGSLTFGGNTPEPSVLTVTNSNNSFNIYLFKSANLDYDEFDTTTLMLDGASRLTFAKGDAEHARDEPDLIGLQPAHLSDTFMTWLDTRVDPRLPVSAST